MSYMKKRTKRNWYVRKKAYLLVRGINVGGKNKVVMTQLRQELTELGLEKVETYINSGNIFFTSTDPKARLVANRSL